MTGFVGRVKLRTRKRDFDYRRFLDGSGGRFKVSIHNFSKFLCGEKEANAGIGKPRFAPAHTGSASIEAPAMHQATTGRTGVRP